MSKLRETYGGVDMPREKWCPDESYGPLHPSRREMEVEMEIERIKKELEELVGCNDPEIAHGKADDLLLEAIEVLGRKDIADLWGEVCSSAGGFWYA